jgi:hypothetical protein
MPPQIAAKDAETAIVILNRCIAIESELTRKFGAQGSGISEKAEFCEHLFPPGFLSRIRFIASVRNKLSHQAEIGSSIDDYIRACDLIDRAILEVPASVGTENGFARDEPAVNQRAQTTNEQIETPPLSDFQRWFIPLLLLATLFGIFQAAKWTWQKVTSPVVLEMKRSTASVDDAWGVSNSLPPGSSTSIPFAAQLTSAPSAMQLSRYYEHVWSASSPDAKQARFSWQPQQAVFDVSHANPVAALPDETFWIIDTSNTGQAQMKELRRPNGRALQIPIILGGTSGLKGILEIPLTKPPRGNRDWRVFRFNGTLRFESGKQVPMPGVTFLNATSNAAPILSEMHNVFSCSGSDKNGCVGWTLNPKVTAVGLSKRGIEYAHYIR